MVTRLLVVGLIVGSCFTPLYGTGTSIDETPSKEAEALHRQGREAGARGNYSEALKLLTRSADLAPGWPYPIYDRAFTKLLMEDFDAALADYERTLTLSPRGFFTAHVAVDTLTREKDGEFPRGLYLAYASLEGLDEAQRRDIVRQLVEKMPTFAPAWLDFAKDAVTPEERLKRIERGLTAKPDAETKGMLRLHQALALQKLGQATAADAILKELASPQSTLAVEAFAKVLLTRK